MSLRCIALLLLALAASTAVGQQDATAPSTPTATSAATPAPAPGPDTLLDGTAIKLRLNETVSSADAKKDQQVSFRVAENVVVNGVVVLRRGAQALATVTEAAPKKGLGRGGRLDISVRSARLADGETLPLRAVKDVHGGGHVAAMTTGIVATTIVFFPAAPLLLFVHGKDITIPAGTEVTAFVQGNQPLDLAKFRELNPSAPPDVPVTIDANTPRAEITVDGAFLGNTPATIQLDPGAHTIQLKKDGFDNWTRTMTVQGDTAKFFAEMKLK